MPHYSSNIVAMAFFLSRLNKYERCRLVTNTLTYNIQDLDKEVTCDDLLDMVNDADMRFYSNPNSRIVFFMSEHMKNTALSGIGYIKFFTRDDDILYFAGRECIVTDIVDDAMIGFAILMGDEVFHITKVKFNN